MKNANIIYENLKNITISLLKEPTSSDLLFSAANTGRT